MKETAKVMKKQFKKINVDKVENLQDKIEDLMLDTEEVNQVLSRTYDNVSEADSAELDDMLDGLDEFDLDDELEEEPDYLKDDAMPSNSLPTVPQGMYLSSFLILIQLIATAVEELNKEGQDEFGLPAQPVPTATQL